MPYFNFNGKLISADKPVLKITNRAFCYGDALFETMKLHDNKIIFFEDHLKRLFEGMKFLKMKISKNFSKQFFQNQIFILIKKNRLTGDVRIRLQVFRNEGGYYTPTDNSVSFVITVEKLISKKNTLQEQGLTVGVFPGIKKTKNSLSNFKSSASNIYTLAGIFAKENKLDDCFILNTDENITDSISSNVFIVKNKTLLTPPLSDGCVNGVMRKNILKFCKKEKIRIIEKSIAVKDLLNAEGIILSNSIQGTRWVKSFRKKTYSNEFSRFLNAKLISSVDRK